MKLDVAPAAIAVGDWSRIDDDGVDTGPLLVLYVPGGVEFVIDGAVVHVTREVTVNVRLGPEAARQLVDELGEPHRCRSAGDSDVSRDPGRG